MPYFLVKSESSCYSIDDLKRDKSTLWTGVRNYQARNFLKAMKVNDTLLYYHSNDEPIGIVGLAKVVAVAEPDPTQFIKTDDHFDPKATKEKPIWYSPKVSYLRKFEKIITREMLFSKKELAEMKLLQKGSRLSVLPVTDREFKIINEMSLV